MKTTITETRCDIRVVDRYHKPIQFKGLKTLGVSYFLIDD